jgi:hypothetical protein
MQQAVRGKSERSGKLCGFAPLREIKRRNENGECFENIGKDRGIRLPELGVADPRD